MSTHLRLARSTLLVLALAALLALAPGRADAASARSTKPAVPPIARKAVKIAKRMVGVPYRWGGTSPRSGFDCSGLVRFVYSRLGVSLPRTSYAQFGAGRRVARRWLKPGDLVFFAARGHVGLYIGRGRFVHATRGGRRVEIDRLGDSWYRSEYVGARRVSA